MARTSALTRSLSIALVTIMLFVGFPHPGHAVMIGTDAVLSDEQGDAARERLNGLLAREDVRNRLISLGVDAEEAADRVAALTDDEAARLVAELDRLPAGGDVLGVAVFIFLVLLVTDILGYTDVFPFTKKAER